MQKAVKNPAIFAMDTAAEAAVEDANVTLADAHLVVETKRATRSNAQAAVAKTSASSSSNDA